MHTSTSPWVGRWLRAVRSRSNVTAHAVAERLGMHPSNLLARERGAASISADDLPSVLAAYGATLADYVRQAKKEGGAS